MATIEVVPDNVLLEIFRYLSNVELMLIVRRVCKRWSCISSTTCLWETITFANDFWVTDKIARNMIIVHSDIVKELDFSCPTIKGKKILTSETYRHGYVSCRQLKRINFSNCDNLQKEDLEFLLRKYGSQLESIDLSKAIEHKLPRVDWSLATNLRKVTCDLSGTDSIGRTFNLLHIEMPARLATLQKLMETVDVQAMLTSPNDLNMCSAVTKLLLRGSCITLSGNHSVLDVVGMLHKALPPCGHKIRSIELWDDMSINDDTLQFLSKCCPNLETFSILPFTRYSQAFEKYSLSDLGVMSALTNCANLKHLDFSGIDSFSNVSFESMDDSIRLNSLKTVDLSEIHAVVADAAVIFFVNTSPNLISVALIKSGVTDAALQYIVDNSTTISDIDVTNCNLITDLGVGALLSYRNLLSLNVSENHQLRDLGASRISGDFLSNVRSLKVNRCYGLQPPFLTFVANFCPFLRRFEAMNVNILKQAALTFFQNMSEIKHLAIGAVNYNHRIDDSFMKMIVKWCPQLASLELVNSSITVNGVKLLMLLPNLVLLVVPRCLFLECATDGLKCSRKRVHFANGGDTHGGRGQIILTPQYVVSYYRESSSLKHRFSSVVSSLNFLR